MTPLFPDFPTKNPKEVLSEYLKQKDYAKALSLVKKLLVEHPQDPFYGKVAVECYMMKKQYHEAHSLLNVLQDQLPDDPQILFWTGQTSRMYGETDHAKDFFLRVIEEFPDSGLAMRAESFHQLGLCHWETSHRDAALSAWKEAVRVSPEHREAQRCLNEHTNEYGEAKAPNPLFDDMYHFLRIHTYKYLVQQNKQEFDNEEETKKVTDAIFQTWNAQMTSWPKKIDKMLAQDKTKLFSSVEVDYTLTFVPPTAADLPSEKIQYMNEEENSFSLPTNKDIEALFKFSQQIFPFLPEGAITMLLLGFPALNYLGIALERFKEFVERRDTPTREEQEILEWVFDLTTALFTTNLEQGTDGELEALIEAHNIARNYLNEDEERNLLDEIKDKIREVMEFQIEENKRQMKKQRKKNKR